MHKTQKEKRLNWAHDIILQDCLPKLTYIYEAQISNNAIGEFAFLLVRLPDLVHL